MTTVTSPGEAILERFAELSQIPRPSKKETRVLAWIAGWADRHHFPHRSDAAGNMVVDVPASAGRESSPIVILQAHVDMVCEKTPDSPHDFDRDPIKLVREGDWLRADGTTLGADNGAAVAIIMKIAEDPSLSRPPLELLFTIDEETGLNGALALDPALLRGRRLINLDSEEVGIFTIGCAGGRTTTARLPLHRIAVDGLASFRLAVGGLHGGHSGVDIHLGRANAIRLLTEILSAIAGHHDIHLQSIAGGKAHNAIPRNAEAVFAVAPKFAADIAKIVADKRFDLKKRWNEADPDLTLTLDPADGAHPAPLTPEQGSLLTRLIHSLPHGVVHKSKEHAGVVETSCNLASVASTEDALEIVVSERSIIMEQLDLLVARVASIFSDHSAEVRNADGYPAWQPDFNSPMLAQAKKTYLNLYGSEARIDVIHAGLECGVIGSKCPGIDMISYGPTIRDPHSPSERLNIPSLDDAWKLTVALLKDL